LFISLWICPAAFGWGELGHKVIAGEGAALAGGAALAACHVTTAQLVEHVNDPDKIWRQERFRHPGEARMHFFHVDRQPPDWRSRSAPADREQGELVYRIVDWIEEAKRLRAVAKWDELAEKLYGLAHYLGDLSQPLHLNHDYDGQEAGLPDIHAQFESKMLNRFEPQVRAGVHERVKREGVPAYWAGAELKTLVFDTAVQSNAKVARLFQGARPALTLPRSRRGRRSERALEPRFSKPLLWQGTGALALDQLAIGSRLLARTLSVVCKP
jgi:hypothetical protein